MSSNEQEIRKLKEDNNRLSISLNILHQKLEEYFFKELSNNSITKDHRKDLEIDHSNKMFDLNKRLKKLGEERELFRN